jgi:starch synthase (maltosyl-transferring)
MPPNLPVSPSGGPLRAYGFVPSLDGEAARAAAAARTLGFSSLFAFGADQSDPAAEGEAVRAALRGLKGCRPARGLALGAWLQLDRLSIVHPLVRDVAPDAFNPAGRAGGVVDPRRPFDDVDGLAVLARPDDPALLAWWCDRLAALAALGVRRFAAPARGRAGGLALTLRGLGHVIDIVDGRPGATAGSAARLLCESRGGQVLDTAARRGDLAEAAASAPGWIIAAGFEDGLEAEVRGVNRLLAARPTCAAPLTRALTGSGAPLRIVLGEAGGAGVLTVRNLGELPAPWPPADALLEAAGTLAPVEGFDAPAGLIAPGQSLLFEARARPPARSRPTGSVLDAAAPAARVVIANVSPAVDGGAYAVKRVVGEPLDVVANIFADGHGRLAAELLVKADDETEWRRSPMMSEPNDVWTGGAAFARQGGHAFCIEAWVDVWGGFCDDLTKKRDAAVDIALELEEGRALIEAARERAGRSESRALAANLLRLAAAGPDEQVAILRSPALAEAMAQADDRPFLIRSAPQPVAVDRISARFSSWYELFPRSQTDDPTRHGTFADVIAHLPRIAAMGFDTLYMPPIHPIGEMNRKGRNNSLVAEPGDLGSPYAIGGPGGGHDAVHPRLGGLDQFHALVAAAKGYGIEIAIDFAIQCAPDHPWVAEHPGWFDWRPDGTIKYAENPPKKYQDIVNVDFYAPGAVPSLWQALRDIVLYWAAQGVSAFRVDNPHTKPLGFWRWMIAEVKARHPEAIFLSEAFTRPRPMYQLAKLGFSQSYTYFTWRNTKQELTDYFTELSQTEVREFFRPHLFVNTPDINPYFLQTSGRAGFLIRAALAATLSGLMGVYAGFEFCEGTPLPGREEYLDSEKYQIRMRPDRAPGDIVDELSQLNAVRRAEPALQSHLGVAFHNAFNDQVLYYSKSAPGQGGLILVAVSLDPHHAQAADFEVPLWLFGLPDHESVEVADLLTGRRFRWAGKMQRLRLTPDDPYAIWRIAPSGGA